MESFALGRGLITETITEVGGGMNFNRKKFNKLLVDIIAGEELSPEQEMTEDLMSIIHTFSCRLYGLRKYKKAKDLIGDETSAQNTDISQ